MTSAQAGCVVVVGGGVIGMSIALELTASHRECVLVDPSPGRGASWAAGGMLSAAAEVGPAEAPLLPDLREAAALWPEFARRVESLSGIAIDYATTGSILVGISRSDSREAARIAQQVQTAGNEVRAIGASELYEVEPTLAPGIAAGWFLPRDHHVDNRLLVEALKAGLKASGVSLLEDRCVGVSVERAGIRARLEHLGDVLAERCVLATGAAPPLPGTEALGARRVRPVRGITLRLRAVEDIELPSCTIRAMVDGEPCYLVPRGNGSLIVGSTSEEQGDARVARAGGVHRLLDAARRVLPALDELHLEEVAVGLRPATEDLLPFVGTLADSRIVAALGHYRNGILLAPLAAARTAALVQAS